jgi:hypothetical protein
MSKLPMRSAIAMIELIFAIVIIAISVISIPTMITVADKASKQITVDDDVMSRLSGWTIDKFQARWDGNYSASGSGPLVMNPNTGDLRCVPRIAGSTLLYRENNNSMVVCDAAGNPPSTIPGLGDGNLTKGIEQLNGGSETITITPAGGTAYNVTATYAVSYVASTVGGTNSQTATWTLGSSTVMAPGATGTSHLKRVVTRFNDNALGVDTTLTFFKSNKGN